MLVATSPTSQPGLLGPPCHKGGPSDIFNYCKKKVHCKKDCPLNPKGPPRHPGQPQYHPQTGTQHTALSTATDAPPLSILLLRLNPSLQTSSSIWCYRLPQVFSFLVYSNLACHCPLLSHRYQNCPLDIWLWCFQPHDLWCFLPHSHPLTLIPMFHLYFWRLSSAKTKIGFIITGLLSISSILFVALFLICPSTF